MYESDMDMEMDAGFRVFERRVVDEDGELDVGEGADVEGGDEKCNGCLLNHLKIQNHLA